MQAAFFQNRVDAGEKLAKELLRVKQNQTSLQDAIVVDVKPMFYLYVKTHHIVWLN
jgi:hypothetical protein